MADKTAAERMARWRKRQRDRIAEFEQQGDTIRADDFRDALGDSVGVLSVEALLPRVRLYVKAADRKDHVTRERLAFERLYDDHAASGRLREELSAWKDHARNLRAAYGTALIYLTPARRKTVEALLEGTDLLEPDS